jgi:hypothetical protein
MDVCSACVAWFVNEMAIRGNQRHRLILLVLLWSALALLSCDVSMKAVKGGCLPKTLHVAMMPTLPLSLLYPASRLLLPSLSPLVSGFW